MNRSRKGRGLSGLLRRRDGAAAVEFAMVLPVLLLILFGTIELGRLIHNYNVVAKGVRDASRYLARVPSTTSCAGLTWSPDSITAVTETKNMATRGQLGGNDANNVLFNFTPTTVTVTTDCINNANGLAGIYGTATTIKRAIVQASVPHSFILGDYVIPGLPTLTYTVVHREPHIGD